MCILGTNVSGDINQVLGLGIKHAEDITPVPCFFLDLHPRLVNNLP